MEQNRFKSPVVWAAVVAQILSILIIMGVINVAQQEAIKTRYKNKEKIKALTDKERLDLIEEMLGLK